MIRYMVVEDGFAVSLTKDRSGISGWVANQRDASKMTHPEAEYIAKECRAFYGEGVQIVGEHCVVEFSQCAPSKGCTK